LIDVTVFGTAEYPLRPSTLGKLIKCPMSVLLTYFGDSEGNQGAQTGSVVHAGVEAFHLAGNTTQGVKEAVRLALQQYPEADRDKVRRWIDAYVTDPTNRAAFVVTTERKVSLEYRGVFVSGTLDQIRRNEDGALVVWDLKTGSWLDADNVVAEYQFQQAAYVLAARQTLDLDVTPGGLIYAAGYDKAMGRRFLPMGVTVADCEQLMDEVVDVVQRIRAGARAYLPTADHCKWCPLKPYPDCKRTGNRILGEKR